MVLETYGNYPYHLPCHRFSPPDKQAYVESEGRKVDWVVWNVGEVYEMAKTVRSLLVSAFNAALPVFFFFLLIASVIMVLHWLFGKDGIL